LDKRKTEEEKQKEAIEKAKAEWLEAKLIQEHKKKKNERNTTDTPERD
jgi:hypothetical protein